MLGVIPGRGKKLVHLAAPKPEAMAHALLDIYGRVKPHAVLMDAVVGMEGNGPNSGHPRQTGLLLASRDGVALDAVAEAIMGFAPGEVQTTAFAHERGLGVGRLDDIDVRGESLENVRIADFAKPVTYKKSWFFAMIPGPLARWTMRQYSRYESVVDRDRCTRCGQCVANCPVSRLRMEDRCVVADGKVCIACYCCEEVCDYDAIHIRRSPLARAAGRIRRALRSRLALKSNMSRGKAAETDQPGNH
jgi:ferredoxin